MRAPARKEHRFWPVGCVPTASPRSAADAWRLYQRWGVSTASGATSNNFAAAAPASSDNLHVRSASPNAYHRTMLPGNGGHTNAMR